MTSTQVQDHPVIRNLERTGYPDGVSERVPRCPICGAKTDTYYKFKCEVIGCDNCVKPTDAWEDPVW